MSAQAVAALYFHAGVMHLRESDLRSQGCIEASCYAQDEATSARVCAALLWDALLIQRTHGGRPWSRDAEVSKALDEAHRAGFADAWALRDATLKAKGT